MQKSDKKNNTTTLTHKQLLFIESYVKDGNATKAAIAAGYSEKAARQQGVRLRTNANISAEIDRIKEKAAERAEINAEFVLSSLKRIAERCMQAVPVLEKVDGEWVETGEFKFDSSGANKALELLGKNLKLWKETGSEENPSYHIQKIIRTIVKPNHKESHGS